MTEHDDKQMASVDTASSKGRRRLMKGMIIGTPAILMVRNGISRPLASFVNGDYEAQAIARICESIGGAPSNATSPTLTSFYGGTEVSELQFASQYGKQCSTDITPPP